MLRVFVYGTLKTGHRNHARCCPDLASVEPAVVTGRLFQRREGYPALLAPAASFLARGGADHAADAALQDRSDLSTQARAWDFAPGPPWRLVLGQVLAFPDPARRLPVLDDLEDFMPGRPSAYCRVLVPARLAHGRVLACWTYVSPHSARFEALPTP